MTGLDIQMIATDLDGTLLNSERRITKENKSAIERARFEGVTIILASGRIGWSIQDFQTQLGISDQPFIGCNGAQAVGHNQIEFRTKWLDDKAKNAVIDIALELNIHLNGYTPEDLLFLQDDEWGDLYLRRVTKSRRRLISVEELRTTKVLKLLLIGEPFHLQSIGKERIAEIEKIGCVATESEPDYLEFLPSNSDKGIALKELSESLELVPDQIAAIGDYKNDLGMLGFAGLPIAMKNADPSAKEISKLIAPSNDDSGVAWAIHHILDNRRNST